MNIIKRNSGDELNYSPKCRICGFQTTIDEFVSECWLSIKTELPHNQHGDTGIWVCPDCIAKKANVS